MLRGGFAAPALWRGKMQFDASGQWLDAREVSFYGFGQDSAPEDRERFDYTPKDIGANVTLRPHALRLRDRRLHVPELRHRSATCRIFSAAEAPGMDEELNYHIVARHGGVRLATVARLQHARRPLSRLVRAQPGNQRSLPYSFSSQEYEVVQLVPLVREQFVLAARGLVTLTTADGGDEVPVMLAPYLGSGSTLRGFSNRRFTDRNRVLLTGEYRWRPSRYLDMALFLDAGQVAADRTRFRSRRIRHRLGHRRAVPRSTLQRAAHRGRARARGHPDHLRRIAAILMMTPTDCSAARRCRSPRPR